jgi:hypothetical protein
MRDFVSRILSGVAILKIDDGISLKSREGSAYQIVGAGETLIRAKLDDDYTSPRNLAGKRVFYRIKRQRDMSNNWRRTIWLAARSGDSPYYGRRIVVLSADGPFLALDPKSREMFAAERTKHLSSRSMAVDYLMDRIGLSDDDLIAMESL